MTLGGFSIQSPLTLTLRHQVGIKHRLLSLLHLRVLSTYKRDSKLLKGKFFVRWRSCTLVEKVRDLGQENERQKEDVEKIRGEWMRAMHSFGQQKVEFESKLEKMAMLIQERLMEKQAAVN